MDVAMPPSQLLDPYAHGITSGYEGVFQTYLGPQPKLEKQSPYNKKDVAKWNFPDAYWDKSEYLRDTVEDWTMTANQTWYTERVMPWFKTNDIHVQWQNWENNAHYMGITPEQAASNVVTQKRQIRQASMIRRGIGAEFELGFISSVLGRASFIASLAQIGRSVQETANIEVIRSLLSCHRYQQVFHLKYGIIRENDVDEYHRRRAERFMCAQKSDTGLETLNVQIDGEMEKYQAKANIWIMGRDVSDYCTVVPETKIWYMFGGQEAVDRLNGKQQGPSAAGGTMGTVDSLMPLRMIKDTPVFLAKAFYVESAGSMDLLTRTVEVGVFNTMVDRTFNYKEYNSKSRSVLVYDNENDDWTEITLEAAIRNCVIWGSDGDVANPFTGIGGRVGRSQVADDGSDLANDFLRYGTYHADGKASTHQAQDVAYIGDLDDKWMSQTNMKNAGLTVYHALKNAYPTAVEAAEKAISNMALDGRIGPAVTTASFDVIAKDGAAGARLFALVQQILGEDNLFFRANEANAAPNTKSSSAGALLWNTFLLQGTYRAKAANAKDYVPLDAAISPAEETSHQNFFEKHLASAFANAAYKERVMDIARNTNKSFQERADDVKAMMMAAFVSDPTSLPGYQQVDAIEKLNDNKVGRYRETLQEVRSVRSRSAQPVEEKVEYFRVGTELPAGYSYLNAAEQQKARRSPTECPSSLSDFTFLSHLFETPARVGYGLSRRVDNELIGAMPPSGHVTELKQRERQRDEFDIDEKGVRVPRQNKDKTSTLTAARLLERFNNLDHRIDLISKGSSTTLIKWLSILYLGSRFNKDRFLQFAANDIYVPCGFLLIRAHATYRTRYGIKCAAMGDSGYTFIGSSDMMLEQEAIRKVGVMHYTAYLSAIVINPKNVYVVEDMFCAGYLGGMGCDFWSRTDYLRHSNNRKLKSIVCTMLPPNMENKISNKIDTRGKFYTQADLHLVDRDRFNKWHYPGASRTAALMGWWDPVRKGRAAADSTARSRKVAMNFLCWQGVQFHWNAKIEDWGTPTFEQGCFGNKVYPGCAAVRNGDLKYLRTPAYLGSQTAIH